MRHVMRIPQPTHGDEEVTWDPDRPDEVKAAQKAFDKAIKEGKRAFKVVRETVARAGEPITKFDASLAEIIFAAPLVGG